MKRVTGIFDDYDDAESAVNQLRELGLTEDHIGILARHGGEAGESTAEATGRGAAIGAGAGALMGIAAAAIPAIGPFITAGVLTGWMGATAGTVAAGAAVGGTSGALAGALHEHAEFPEDEAEEYASRVREGSVLVVADVGGDFEKSEVLDVFERNDAWVHAGQPA